MLLSTNGPRTKVKYFLFQHLLLSSGWMSSAYVGVDENGIVKSVSKEKPESNVVEKVNGIAIPGFQNCHSHAFQYAMAGMAELHSPGTNDDFWSWREAMYQCALSLDPTEIQTVATALYIEMLKNGYTSVAEFHYLHHDKNGKPYENSAEISVALLAAAALAGIRITLIPVHYKKGGFGMESQPRQRRFIFQNVDEYFRLLESAGIVARNMSTACVGFGVHSLRAVDGDDTKRIFQEGPRDLPFHLHAAEQLKEVEDCKKYLNARPVEWLLDNLSVSERFNIVHCTHLTDDEISGLAKSKASVVLCPGTEGNLGDGVFRLSDYARQKGNWCIGTDSHISLNPLEDLRWLDYGQRLLTHKRNTFDDGGATMLSIAYHSGLKAMGSLQKEFFEVNRPFDAVVYDSGQPLLSGARPEHLLSRLLYTSDTRAVVGTIVNGKWIVKNGFHKEDEKTSQMFRQIIQSLSV